jgi:hypothetical protein
VTRPELLGRSSFYLHTAPPKRQIHIAKVVSKKTLSQSKIDILLSIFKLMNMIQGRSNSGNPIPIWTAGRMRKYIPRDKGWERETDLSVTLAA